MENVQFWIIGIIGIIFFTGLLSILISIFLENDKDSDILVLHHTKSTLSAGYVSKNRDLLVEDNDLIDNEDIVLTYENLESEVFNL